MAEYIPPAIADAILADIAARGSNFQYMATKDAPKTIEELADYILGRGNWEDKQADVLTNDELYTLLATIGEYEDKDVDTLLGLLSKSDLYRSEGYDFN
jgi:hypothetical protein